MRLQRIGGGAAAVVLVALALVAAASANHVSATFTATAKLGKRVGNSWTVEIQWAINCQGTSSPLYFGNLSLDEQGGAGQSFYLGGTSTGSGTSTATVPMTDTPRRLKPHLKSSCSSSGDFHGSGSGDYLGNEVVVPALACDPDLLAKALREYDVARSFYDAVAKDFANAREKSDKTLSEKLKTKAAKKAVKKALTAALAELSADAAAAASVALFYVKIGVIIQKILLNVLPALNETRKAHNEAHKDFERGETWRKRAEADLEAALRQGPCTGPSRAELDRALDEQRRQQAARDLIESWENNGYLYLDPATGEVLDEAAALRKARRALESGQRSTQSRASSAPRRLAATRRQIKAALAQIAASERIDARVERRLRRADAAAETLRKRLLALS